MNLEILLILSLEKMFAEMFHLRHLSYRDA